MATMTTTATATTTATTAATTAAMVRGQLQLALALALALAALASSGCSGGQGATGRDGSTVGDLAGGSVSDGGGSGSDGGGGSGGTGGSGGAWLHTAGNAILHADGTRFHGKGVDIPDQRGDDACYATPDVAEENRRIDELAAWGANFIRLTLESDKVADDVSNDAAYLAALKTVVAHAVGKGIYVEVSLWVDPTVDGNELPTAASDAAWTVLATAFATEPRVLFGITNEPHDTTDAAVWSAMNTAVDTIRKAETAAHGQAHLVVVQGTQRYARDTIYYATHPITAGGGANIAYETHVYDPQSEFDKLVTTPAKSLPLIIGEFGPVNAGPSSGMLPGSTPMTVDDCLALVTLAKKLEVPFLAWSFHMRTAPNLLVDNSNGGCGIGMTLAPTSDWGVPFKAALGAAW